MTSHAIAILFTLLATLAMSAVSMVVGTRPKDPVRVDRRPNDHRHPPRLYY